jgi:hypothetical protein
MYSFFRERLLDWGLSLKECSWSSKEIRWFPGMAVDPKNDVRCSVSFDVAIGRGGGGGVTPRICFSEGVEHGKPCSKEVRGYNE